MSEPTERGLTPHCTKDPRAPMRGMLLEGLHREGNQGAARNRWGPTGLSPRPIELEALPVPRGQWPSASVWNRSLVAAPHPPTRRRAGLRGQSPETVILGAALHSLRGRKDQCLLGLRTQLGRAWKESSRNTCHLRHKGENTPPFAFSLPLIFSLRILISWFLC